MLPSSPKVVLQEKSDKKMKSNSLGSQNSASKKMFKFKDPILYGPTSAVGQEVVYIYVNSRFDSD